MENEILYKKSASMIFWSALIVALLPLIETLASTMEMVDELSRINDPMEFIMSCAMNSFSDSGSGFENFVPIITIVCYITFFIGLIKFSKAQDDDEDAYDVRRIKNGILLFLIADVVDWLIPLAGYFIYLILNLIGYILIIGGTSRLGRSITMSSEANSGFRTLKHAYIWSLVVAILSIILNLIPFLPFILKLVLCIVNLVGWNKVRKSEPFEYEEEPVSHNTPTQAQSIAPTDEFEAAKAILDTLKNRSLEELNQIVNHPELYSPQYHTAAKVAIAEREKALKPLSLKSDTELREIIENSVVYAPTHVLAAKDELWRRTH